LILGFDSLLERNFSMLDSAISIKYMLAGYTVVLVLLPAYLASLVLRRRALKRKLEDLDDLSKK
jgi:CcmD family protein